MKHYNPFKMWGSWVGVIPIIILMILSPIIYNLGGCGNREFDLFGLPDYFNPGGPNCSGFLFHVGQWIFLIFILPILLLTFLTNKLGINLNLLADIPLIIYIFPIIFNFFIGYGIHALIRKLRR